MSADWMTPEELAAELGRSVRFVKEAMASGEIPSIRIGSRRYFTPECRAQLVQQQLGAKVAPAESWGRVTRRRA